MDRIIGPLMITLRTRDIVIGIYYRARENFSLTLWYL